MSVRAFIASLFSSDTDTEDGGFEAVAQLLVERESTLNITAEFGEPRPNMESEPTIVIPYTAITDDGVEYCDGSREFPLPDNGLEDSDSALALFIANIHDIEAEDVNLDYLEAVKDMSVDANLTEYGNIALDY